MSVPALPLSRLLESVADAVAGVRAGRSLTELLARCPEALRAGTQALAFLALRHLGAALVLRPMLAPRPPPPRVDAMLLTALALSWPGESAAPYADHTLVDQTVDAVRRRTPSAAGFVNAVLRCFIRDRAALVERALREPLARWQHPDWWVAQMRADWPQRWPALLADANRHAPMVLRVNARRGDAAGYVRRLAAAGIEARSLASDAAPHAVLLARPCPVHELPGFAQGDASVQDHAAQRAAPLLLGLAGGLQPLPAGARVLDACAAPGGKTAHLLELAGDGASAGGGAGGGLDLLALDIDARRLLPLQHNLDRLGLAARLQAADARQVDGWWDGRPFDAILLDAPCTASGIVRRHPDVRWLRRPGDIVALAQIQSALLDTLWPLLKPGGRLLYATCSVFRAEGSQQIDAFLQRHAASGPRLAPGSPGHLDSVPDNPGSPADPRSDAGAEAGAQARAAPALADGFYYALISKS